MDLRNQLLRSQALFQFAVLMLPRPLVWRRPYVWIHLFRRLFRENKFYRISWRNSLPWAYDIIRGGFVWHEFSVYKCVPVRISPVTGFLTASPGHNAVVCWNR